MDQNLIIDVFNQCFLESERTRLVGGAQEPWYEPVSAAGEAAVLYCRADYLASALHETAHWCLATPQQRALTDFGFSYIAPPRTLAQQRRFFELELPVQSLEALFSNAAGVEFRVSADSFDKAHVDLINEFEREVTNHQSRTYDWLSTPEGARANQFATALKSRCD